MLTSPCFHPESNHVLRFPHRSTMHAHRLKATRKIALGLAATSGFSTLRDQHGINEIDLSELKTIKKLGEERSEVSLKHALLHNGYWSACIRGVKSLSYELQARVHSRWLSCATTLQALKHRRACPRLPTQWQRWKVETAKVHLRARSR